PTAAWLRRSARFLWLQQVRRAGEVALDVEEQVWEQVERDPRAGALRRCLERLTERGRQAVESAYGERRSWADIGARLGMQASGVKTLLRRCRATLRECIEKTTKEVER
ncbi:MAG: sigma-70 family RNA polymerase sigma factor, partial [Planctomycetes bacterium]|nr:sigma-70 family RNA polymerase sigma factor [Planctomycetota bacterium]